MKQVLQNPRSGALELVEVPAPSPDRGQVLVRTAYSVLSPGTEKMAVDFARKSMLGKARSRPDLVKQVTRKLRQEGPLPTYRAVMNRLDAPQPLGYASAGVVEAVGAEVTSVRPGDRVACAGAGYASHAELAVVPENLVVPVPQGLSLEKAAFATLGAIALQGVRVAGPQLGEIAAVVGLGLIGQLSVQLLRANGCRVLGIDLDATRVEQALAQGATWGAAPGDDFAAWADAATEGHGADFVLVTAASESSAPIDLAARLCRMKGRVVAVGATAMELDRRAFYEKELELRMSMSYGPGRYDRRYEELGLDYPLPYVRWTERRNLGAFLELAASGAIDPDALDARTVDFERAVEVYDELASGERRNLAVVFRYAEEAASARTLTLPTRAQPAKANGKLGVAFLGAGNYAKGVLLPALEGEAVALRHLVTATGPSARRTAERFGFATCGTDPEAALADPEVDLVFVASRHDTHAFLAERAVRAGKAVWLEKPLALGPEEAASLASAVRETGGFLAVGYNRRFSPHTAALREAFGSRRGPMAIHYTVAAGPCPRGTWIADPAVGGGRIVGEVCHFVDLCGFLVGDRPAEVSAHRLGRDPETDDAVVILLAYPDGSAATLHYLTRASDQLPKEHIECSADGRTGVCENFRITRFVGERRPAVRGVNQDKGQKQAIRAVLEAVNRGEPSPFDVEALLAVSDVTFRAAGLSPSS